MQPTRHILIESGILTNFSISKKITEKEISDLISHLEKKGIPAEDFTEYLKEKIFTEVALAFKEEKIPGLIFPSDNFYKKAQKRIKTVEGISGVNRFAQSIVNQHIIQKKYDKFLLCNLINSIINELELTEEDFERYHKKMSKLKEKLDEFDDSDSDNDDDDDDEDDDSYLGKK